MSVTTRSWGLRAAAVLTTLVTAAGLGSATPAAAANRVTRSSPLG